MRLNRTPEQCSALIAEREELKERLLSALKDQETGTGVPGFAGRAGGPIGPEPSGLGPAGRSSLTHLAELSAKAAPGPWHFTPDEYSDPDYTDEPSDNPLGVLMSAAPGRFVTTYDLEGSGSITPDDAAFIIAAVNYVRDALPPPPCVKGDKA